MDLWLSNKFRWLSLIATWAVICIHSRTDRWASGVNDYASRLEMRAADLFFFAVPLFFVISGYMFVHSYNAYGWIGLLRRKFRSLYVPMLIWSVLGVSLCLPIRLYSHHDIPTMLDVVKLPLMAFRSEAVHFWYVRALIVFFVAAPLMAYVSRNIWLTSLLMCGALFIPGDSLLAQLHIPVAVVFFLLGTQLVRIKLANCHSRVWFGVCMVGLVFSFSLKGLVSQYVFSSFLEPLFMIGVLWFGYDIVDAKRHIGNFPESMHVLFFVYCMHLITLCWFGGVLRGVLGNGPVARLVGYFSMWLTFWLDVWMANLTKRRLPCMYRLMSGGR